MDRETDSGQTERQTADIGRLTNADTQADKQADRQAGRPTAKKVYRHGCTLIDKQKDTQADAAGQTDRSAITTELLLNVLCTYMVG